MKYSRNEALEDQLLSEMMDWMSDDRKHPTLTDLIYCMTKSFMYSKDKNMQRSRKTKLFFLYGLGLEKALLIMRGGKSLDITPSHMGIQYHSDSLIEKDMIEAKSTRMGIKVEPDEFPMGWKRQAMGYCLAEGIKELDFAVMHIIQAEIQCWHVEFTQEELDTNWEWIMMRKPIWDRAEETGIPPRPFTTNEDWECKDCELLAYCKGMTGRL